MNWLCQCAFYRQLRKMGTIYQSLANSYRNIMATLADIKTIADKISADIDTKLAAEAAKVAAAQAQVATLTTELAAAQANAVDPVAAQAIVDGLTAADAKLS